MGGAVIGQLEPSQPHNVSHPFNGAGFVRANDGSALASGLARMLRAGSTRNHGGPWS